MFILNKLITHGKQFFHLKFLIQIFILQLIYNKKRNTFNYYFFIENKLHLTDIIY